MIALDRAPQVKLGWKVVQMERRGVPSDRGNQLREVKAENTQRQAVVLDIGQLRDQFTRRVKQEKAERKTADQKKLIARVEAALSGKWQRGRESLLAQWRRDAGKDIPQVENARQIWEKDHWDTDAKAWRETRNSIQWETSQVEKDAKAVEG